MKKLLFFYFLTALLFTPHPFKVCSSLVFSIFHPASTSFADAVAEESQSYATPWTSSPSVTWELVKNAEPQAPPLTY